MRRKILLTKLMLVLFVSVCTGQSQDNFHKLLEKLDREIDLRSVFHARREGRIAELKDTLKDPALSESKLMKATEDCSGIISHTRQILRSTMLLLKGKLPPKQAFMKK